ncbi:MAG TPA: OmpA family protein [Thiobacillaceae bacterium]|nr:OmpA family protein [Thiobacillaceae bacterium]
MPSALGAALLAALVLPVQAAESPYYNPANPASNTGFTTAYELNKTIGCPGRGILEAPCKEPQAAAKPAAAAPAPKDSDRDGVTDDKDQCPTTPLGRKVDARGCELDGDGDGVVDALDQCPTTPPGRKVNAQGCELDGDGDGVIDALDRCPTTPPGRKVNAQGCELDSDGDGVVDALDQCPDTPAGAKVDGKGCELDSDGDGVVDRLDRCPDTPAGTKVDANGCTLDSDRDGVPDAKDRCPNSAPGAKVDANGCDLPKVIILRGVNFDNDSNKLRADALATLDKAVDTLKANPGVRVEVAGHTDSRADDAYNQRLSERRARAVLDYFVSKGVEASRLTWAGYGEAQPIADNSTEEGRHSNRRVELRILD